jgi:hypothetical protein
VAAIEEAPLQAALEKLADADILLVQSWPPKADYRFKHALIQDAAYENLLKSRRLLGTAHLSLPETQSVWSAVTNRLMLADDGRSLQIDLVGGCWAIPVSDIPRSRESGDSAPTECAPLQVSGTCCVLGC